MKPPKLLQDHQQTSLRTMKSWISSMLKVWYVHVRKRTLLLQVYVASRQWVKVRFLTCTYQTCSILEIQLFIVLNDVCWWSCSSFGGFINYWIWSLMLLHWKSNSSGSIAGWWRRAVHSIDCMAYHVDRPASKTIGADSIRLIGLHLRHLIQCE